MQEAENGQNNMALGRFHQSGQTKYAPSVQKNIGLIIDKTFQFNDTSFSKGWADPLNGNPGLVTIKSIPAEIILSLNEIAVNVGDTFFSVNGQNLTVMLDDKYAIHNGVLYRFEKSIDAIIADQEALNRKLIQNISGVLWFVNPDDLGDTALVQGVGIRNTDLEFTFTTRSSVSALDSNMQTFCLIPWENVNLKDNYILPSVTVDPGTIDNPINYFNITPSEVDGVRTINVTIRLLDGTEFNQSFQDERGTASDITVTDLNDRTNRTEIGKINLKTFFESITDLTKIEHVPDTKKVRWFYRNETGAEYYREFDFTPIMPATVLDINVDTLLPDANDADIWILKETDGTEHQIDLNKYVASVTVDSQTGAVSLFQNGIELLSVGLAGQTNDYYDLDNLPTIPGPFNLPNGLKDQIYYIEENGTNRVKPYWMMVHANVVQSQEEFEILSATGLSLKDVFENWEMFSHYNVNLGGGVAPPNFPVITPDDPQESTRLTADEFYNRTAWGYDEANDRIYLNKNYHPHTGFISPREYGIYTLEATMSSPNSDDDWMGLVIAFKTDIETGYEHTLTVYRCLVENSGQGDFTYRVVYNFGQTNEKVLIDATDQAPFPIGGSGGWTAMGPTRVQVQRNIDDFTIKCSQFGSTNIDEATTITFAIADYPELEVFTQLAQVGFSARSQKDAYFSDIEFEGLTDYIFWDKGDDSYDTYEWNRQTETYELQNPQSTFLKDYIGKNRFIYTEIFDKVFHVDRRDKLICVKGDEGISKQAFNALSLGWDNRPFIDSRLVGGTENKKIYYDIQHVSGLDFKVIAAWRINGIESGVPNRVVHEFTTTADATHSKYILTVLNEDGTITVKEGTPSVNPQEPTLDDPASQLKGSFVQINSDGSIEGFTGILVYDENVQVAGGEWDSNIYPAGATARIDLNATNEVFSGTKGLEFIDAQKFDAAEFDPENPIPIVAGDKFQYRIKNKTVSSGKKQVYPQAMIQGVGPDGYTLESYTFPIDPNYDRDDITTWQVLSAQIPSGLPFDEIKEFRLVILGDNNQTYSGYIDEIEHIEGTGISVPQNGVDAEYVKNEDEKYLQLAKDHADQQDVINLQAAKDYADSLSSDSYIAQIIDLGDIGVDTVEDAFNDDALAASITTRAGEKTLIKATQDSVAREWLFIGKDQIYNGTSTLSTANDFFLGGTGATSGGAGGGTATFKEDSYTWNTGDPNTFTVDDSAKVTDVYLNGKRLEKFEEDGVTADEWQINDATTIEILVGLTDTDKISIIASSVGVASGQSKTGTELDISNALGNNYNYASASSASTFTFINPVVNGYAKSLINATSEPTVTGATKITGSDFIANTNMELVVESVDGTNVRYFFLEL